MSYGRNIFRCFVAAALGLAASAAARAQCPPQTVTGGLLSPSKIVQTPLGNLLVAEFGTTAPNTGRVSVVGPDGNRRTLLGGLPSGVNEVGDVVGTTGLFLRGRTLYVVNGQGDATLAGPAPGTEVPNPHPSSPIFSSVLAVNLSAAAEQNTHGFTLTAAQHQALKNGARLTLGAGGDRLTVELAADFPDYAPDPRPFFPANVRHSNPYGVVAEGERLYVVDAGANAVRRVELATGAHTVLTTFAPIPNPLPLGPPFVEAVPTSIRADGGRLLVTLFRGFPFPPGAAEVRSVNPSTGQSAPFIGGLSAAIDVLPVRGRGGDTDYLTLELSTDLLASAPGRLRRYDAPASAPSALAGCLISPSGMAHDPKTGTLYVTEIFTGRIVTLKVP